MTATGERRSSPQPARVLLPGKVHFWRWAPADWLGSTLRGELAMERDHVTRLVYRELLDVLFDRGGRIARSEVAGSCLVSTEDVEKAVERLKRGGWLEETPEGELSSALVDAALSRERAYRAGQAESGRRGGLRKALNRQAQANASEPRATASPPNTYTVSDSRSFSEGVGFRDSTGGEWGGDELPLEGRVQALRHRIADLGDELHSTRELEELVSGLPATEVEHAVELANAARVDGHSRSVAAYLVGILREKRAAREVGRG